MVQRTCLIPDCENSSRARGWCEKHYKRWLRTGSLGVARPKYDTPEKSFKAKTKRDKNCLLWTGYVCPDGYGRIYSDGTSVLAHRYAWERANGPILDNMQIDHICFNTSCVEVTHLRLSTGPQNVRHLNGPRKNNATGYRGVSWHAKSKKYVARVQHNKKEYSAGYFSSPKEAAVAAAMKRRELGFPESDYDRELLKDLENTHD